MLLNARDTINGNEGTITATINGQVENLAYVKSFSAQVILNKEEVNILGDRATHHKVTGWSGDGSMTIHYITSTFRKMVADYTRTGILPAITLVGRNADPQSSVGAQTVSISNVLIDGTDLVQLDSDAPVLEEDINFTFSRFELLDEFGRPVAG